MPVFNSERTIREAVNAVLGQSFDDIELIISDNNSTDGTRAICEEYAAHDRRVRYVRNSRNIGIAANYNAVFRLARARYFKWASSNDMVLTTFLEQCFDFLARHDRVVLVHCGTRLFTDGALYEDTHDDLNLLDEDPCVRFRSLLERMRLNNAMNGLIRASALAKTPLMRGFYGSDCSLMAELVLRGKFAELPEVLFVRRMDARSATAKMSPDAVASFFNPGTRQAPLFSTWRLHQHYLGAVWRAPISATAKLCVARYIARSLRWSREKLAREVRDAGRRVVSMGKAENARPGCT
jgi:glycosyltransferase involved in cell wall biosynthesis